MRVQRLDPFDDSVVIWLKPDIYQVENSVSVLYFVHGSGARLIQLVLSDDPTDIC